MTKKIVIFTIVAVIGAGIFFAWQYAKAPSSSLIQTDPGFYTLGSVNARFKVPPGWNYSTNDTFEFAAFWSPDFKRQDGSQNPFGSEAGATVEGAIIIIPLFLFVESNPQPVGRAVVLDNRAGDIVHGTDNSGTLPVEYDWLRLHDGSQKIVLLSLEYAPGYPGASELMNSIAASFKFN